MMRMVFALIGVLLTNNGVSAQPQPEQAQAWPKDWSEFLGKQVILEGTAEDLKSGALLVGKEGSIFIDGLDSWPNGYWQGEGKSKRLRVTGIVIKKDDVPVFVPQPGLPPLQGIPVATEEEARKRKWRYLLKNAKWTVLEN